MVAYTSRKKRENGDKKNKLNIKDVIDHCNNALKTYCNEQVQKNKNISEPIFGYVFRSNLPEITKQHSNIIIESSLFRKN